MAITDFTEPEPAARYRPCTVAGVIGLALLLLGTGGQRAAQGTQWSGIGLTTYIHLNSAANLSDKPGPPHQIED